MRYLRDAESIPYPGIRALVCQRMAELSQDDLFDPATMGSLILVEPGDTAAQLEKECGCLITTGLFGDAKFGDPEFMPCFEWLEHHADARCYEMLFVMTDDGNGTALFVPDEADIDPELLAFCRTYATPVEADCPRYPYVCIDRARQGLFLRPRSGESMITIKTYSDLAKVDPANPALPVLEEVLLRLFAVYATPEHPYRPEHHGYIVLIEEGDVGHALDLPELHCRLEEVPWEGAAMHGGCFHAVYLANNEFGISFLIPDAPWVKGELRAALEELVP